VRINLGLFQSDVNGSGILPMIWDFGFSLAKTPIVCAGYGVSHTVRAGGIAYITCLETT